jgi:hypothetical protein
VRVFFSSLVVIIFFRSDGFYGFYGFFQGFFITQGYGVGLAWLAGRFGWQEQELR